VDVLDHHEEWPFPREPLQDPQDQLEQPGLRSALEPGLRRQVRGAGCELRKEARELGPTRPEDRRQAFVRRLSDDRTQDLDERRVGQGILGDLET
jgi:hypothetical protein